MSYYFRNVLDKTEAVVATLAHHRSCGVWWSKANVNLPEQGGAISIYVSWAPLDRGLSDVPGLSDVAPPWTVIGRCVATTYSSADRWHLSDRKKSSANPGQTPIGIVRLGVGQATPDTDRQPISVGGSDNVARGWYDGR